MVLFATAVMLSSVLIQISALVGGLLPLVVAFIQQEHWSAAVQTVVGVAACFVASIITAWASGKLNVTDWAASFITIFLMTKTTYLAVWKNVGLTDAIRANTSRRVAGK